MKRMIAILLAVMLMSCVFTACSGTASFDDGMGYGNVSTTPDGRVNGGEYYNGQRGGMFGNDGMFDSSNGGRGNYGGSYNGGSGSYNGNNGTNGSGSNSSGSGMTGGR